QQPTSSQTFRKCRQTNYVTEGAKIYAVDPADPSTKTQIFIKGVTWSGMELPKQGIPQGLWGKGLTQTASGITGTSLADMMQFMTNNSINVVRFPLTADNIVKDTPPMASYVHGENKEIALYPEGFTPRTSDFVARLIGAFQKYRIGIVLDIHDLVDNFDTDAYWYYPKISTVEETLAYKAAVVLATNYCKDTYWNVLGLDLKNAMTDATWAKVSKDAVAASDWASAAQAIAAKVNELCPQWLVFTTGASSSNGETFSIPSRSKETFTYWNGGNFVNATARPLNASNIVYAPQAHTHGLLPKEYLYAKEAGCG
ncbi:cell 5A endo-1,4-betaglucanase, partial [Achlya hypogyna]